MHSFPKERGGNSYGQQETRGEKPVRAVPSAVAPPACHVHHQLVMGDEEGKGWRRGRGGGVEGGRGRVEREGCREGAVSGARLWS